MELPGMTENLLGDEEPDYEQKRFQPVVNLEWVNLSSLCILAYVNTKLTSDLTCIPVMMFYINQLIL